MRNYFKLPLLALALAMPGTGFAKSFPKEKDLAAYLMVFHRDDTHGLYSQAMGTGLQQTGKVNQINFALKMSKTFT